MCVLYSTFFCIPLTFPLIIPLDSLRREPGATRIHLFAFHFLDYFKANSLSHARTHLSLLFFPFPLLRPFLPRSFFFSALFGSNVFIRKREHTRAIRYLHIHKHTYTYPRIEYVTQSRSLLIVSGVGNELMCIPANFRSSRNHPVIPGSAFVS